MKIKKYIRVGCTALCRGLSSLYKCTDINVWHTQQPSPRDRFINVVHIQLLRYQTVLGVGCKLYWNVGHIQPREAYMVGKIVCKLYVKV